MSQKAMSFQEWLDANHVPLADVDGLLVDISREKMIAAIQLDALRAGEASMRERSAEEVAIEPELAGRIRALPLSTEVPK